MARGLLLINLGTPKATNLSAICRYLNEFLMDKRVIDLPWYLRHLLVKGLVLPFRSKKSAPAYKAIWLREGSPLLHYSRQLCDQLQKEYGKEYRVALGMRYGQPSIATALNELKECEELTILPLYPQYSSAATGSAIEQALKIIKQKTIIPSIKIINHFYQNQVYIQAQSQLIKRYLKAQHYLLFSYHGIPERQIVKSGCQLCCPNECTPQENPQCYKAQCYQTTHLLAKSLNLSKEQYGVSFQSRLGKTPWIKPYTEELLIHLAAQGIKKLTIVCPSFVTDCLETLEEIGLGAQAKWQQLGGQEFILIPSLNDEPLWIQAINSIVYS